MVVVVVLDDESIGALGKACGRWDNGVPRGGARGRLCHFRTATV